MVLFVSDMHFGRGAPPQERKVEQELLACLRAHEEAIEGLVLVGDIFEQYIEYRYLLPKGFVRFQALLAEWSDRGVPITYLTGNHDPWHLDYFESELGVRVISTALHEPLSGRNVYMAHGDGFVPRSRLYNRLKPVLRHRLPVTLYRNLFPGDGGFGFARWFNRRFRSPHRHEDHVIRALRTHARRVLTRPDIDLVVMGHSHYPELQSWPEGQYLNTGSWFLDRTFGRLDQEGPSLLQWTNGGRIRTFSLEN